TTQPGSATAGSAFGQQPVVKVEDANGNLVGSGADSAIHVVMSLFSGGGSLLGTTDVQASAGVATFTDLQINTAGAHTLSADGTLSNAGAVSASSNSFSVNPAGLDHFLVEAQGGGNISAQTAGSSFNLQITAQDQFDNIVTGFSGTVDLTSNRTIGAGG